MPEATSMIAEQFDSAEQQEEAAHLGMWTFLATEVLFFGGMLMGYIVYRHAYFSDFANGSRHTDLVYGTLNTAILLTSSLWMALAAKTAKDGAPKPTVRFLLLTILFAAGFLVVKGFEYSEDIHEHLVPGSSFGLAGKAQLFFCFYWALTGLHALHVIIGMGLLSVMAWLAKHGKFSREYNTPVEIAGLYWHFVDIVWIVLYPLLYLIGRSV